MDDKFSGGVLAEVTESNWHSIR